MAKRVRRSRTTRRGGARDARTSDAGQDRRRHTSSPRAFDAFSREFFNFSRLLDPAHPLGRLNSLILLHGLEWQATALTLYRRALQEAAFDAPSEDRLRAIARSMMGVYLEFVKSIPERREQLISQHSDLAKVLSDTLDDLRRRLIKPSGRPASK